MSDVQYMVHHSEIMVDGQDDRMRAYSIAALLQNPETGFGMEERLMTLDARMVGFQPREIESCVTS
jgi:hypothetical protein